MSKLSIDQKSIKDLFQSRGVEFLIPDYQRPYEWDEAECRTLWEDLFNFAIPNGDVTKFDENEEYFLGPIVTFKNADGKLEVIDGQQRLTTLMLLLRAFYPIFIHMMDPDSQETKRDIEKCLWQTTMYGVPNMELLKINSEVASDNDNGEFIGILRTGEVTPGMESRYAHNFNFFKGCIADFKERYAMYCSHLAMVIMQYCVLLPIEADSQDTALRIFSTLNDRGKPLSDADIFKAQFYKYFTSLGEKDTFIEQWKSLEAQCERIFQPISGTPMDELFTRYMYYLRAKQGITRSTTEALRKFYERDGYAFLRDEKTFSDLVTLANFWEDVAIPAKERFSSEVLKHLFILNYAPNGMWTYFVSVYFMQNKEGKDNALENKAFAAFLQKIIGFIWTYAVTNPGVNALRTPVYAEMVNLVNGQPVEFAKYKFSATAVRRMFDNFLFLNGRPITKAMLTWWAFQEAQQEELSLETKFEIEHIYARNRYNKEGSLKDRKNLDSLGNKALLEKHVNIRASDYRFEDKKKFYRGFILSNGKNKGGTHIAELKRFAETMNDFGEEDIVKRYQKMMDRFIQYLKEQHLLDEVDA